MDAIEAERKLLNNLAAELQRFATSLETREAAISDREKSLREREDKLAEREALLLMQVGEGTATPFGASDGSYRRSPNRSQRSVQGTPTSTPSPASPLGFGGSASSNSKGDQQLRIERMASLLKTGPSEADDDTPASPEPRRGYDNDEVAERNEAPPHAGGSDSDDERQEEDHDERAARDVNAVFHRLSAIHRTIADPSTRRNKIRVDKSGRPYTVNAFGQRVETMSRPKMTLKQRKEIHRIRVTNSMKQREKEVRHVAQGRHRSTPFLVKPLLEGSAAATFAKQPRSAGSGPQHSAAAAAHQPESAARSSSPSSTSPIRVATSAQSGSNDRRSVPALLQQHAAAREPGSPVSSIGSAEPRGSPFLASEGKRAVAVAKESGSSRECEQRRQQLFKQEQRLRLREIATKAREEELDKATKDFAEQRKRVYTKLQTSRGSSAKAVEAAIADRERELDLIKQQLADQDASLAEKTSRLRGAAEAIEKRRLDVAKRESQLSHLTEREGIVIRWEQSLRNKQRDVDTFLEALHGAVGASLAASSSSRGSDAVAIPVSAVEALIGAVGKAPSATS